MPGLSGPPVVAGPGSRDGDLRFGAGVASATPRGRARRGEAWWGRDGTRPEQLPGDNLEPSRQHRGGRERFDFRIDKPS